MLELHLLGERRLSRGRQDLTAVIRYRKGWALLGYLAVERGRRHPREKIAELLWPDLRPASARTNLRQVLTDLNQAFDCNGGEGLLESTRETIGLAVDGFPHARVSLDLLALEAAQAMPIQPDAGVLAATEQHVQQLGGEFMAGFALADCPAYEEWLGGARRQLAGATVESLARLCRIQQVHGRVPQAIATARGLVALDEWNEEFQRQLMRLLAAAGLHQQALEQYQALSDSLASELGASPEPRTAALRAEIEADGRRVRAIPGAAPVASALAAQVRRWLGDLAGSADAGDPDTGLPTQRTLPVAGTRPGKRAARGWLEVELGADPGRRVAVAGSVLVGRSRENDLCIAHDTVSRQHCVVWHDDDGFRVRDLGSTNGTRVNDAIVQEAALDHGDRIVLGETVLRFDCAVEDPTASDTTR